MSLYPTKTRLALLADVADGRVYGRYVAASTAFDSYSLREDGRGPGSKVTSRMVELEQAGWVRRGTAQSTSYFSRRPWCLTDAGRAVLAGGSGG